tara:strand:+ start:2372 stop:3298 length:927 start_codon:yes stop_codon:yes gene_type:complete
MARINFLGQLFNQVFGQNNKENENPQHITNYPKNWVTVTSAGHVLEFDNTKDGERIRIINGATGSIFEMDELSDTYVISSRDLHLNSDATTTLKVGKNKKQDKLIIQVIGDAHFNVEGDLHTEVEGDRFDKVNGRYELKCGDIAIDSASGIGINADNELRLIANSINQRCTFSLLDMLAGGFLQELINGNRVIRMNKEGGTFAIESAGDLRFNVEGCRYDNVGRNHFTEVQGSMKTTTHGKNIDCIQGGAPDGMEVTKSYGTGWELDTKGSDAKINTTDFRLQAQGTVQMTASGSEFRITCNNGIYLN